MSTLHKTWKVITFGMVACGALLVWPAQLSAAELSLLSSLGVKPVIDALAPGFERATGYKWHIHFALTPQIPQLAAKGEAFDVAITSPKHIVEMTEQGKIAANSARDVARFSLAIGVRGGAAKPDVASPAALKRVLLDAKSVAYVGTGSTGPLVLAALEKLGVANEVKPKLKSGSVAENFSDVARGKTEMLVMPVPLIKAAKGVALAGALPPAVQQHVMMTAGVSASSQNRKAAEALVKFLVSPEAQALIIEKGYDRLPQHTSR